MTNEFQQLISNIKPDVYQNLKTAVEVGRWPNGVKLTAEQRHLSLQAIIAYEVKHLPPEERTGYVPPIEKSGCKGDKKDNKSTQDDSPNEPLHWV